jgi:hypothetical protein
MNCKYCAHRRTCETSLHDDDYCADYRTSCPLPRIGSKEWGWTWNKKTEKYESKHCKYWLDPSGASDGAAELFEVMFQGEHHPCTVGSYMLLSDAKRFAELLARRDWRRENRGKR